MVCIIRTPEGELKVKTYEELVKVVDAGKIQAPYWVAKCVGNDDETARMRSLLLDLIPDTIAFYKDGSFGPYEGGDE